MLLDSIVFNTNFELYIWRDYMKEIFKNLRDFIVADIKNMKIINSSLSRIQKLAKKFREEKDFYNKLGKTIHDIAKAITFAGRKKSIKVIKKKKLEVNFNSLIKKLSEIDRNFSRIFWLFFWCGKMIVEFNLGFNLPIPHRINKLLTYYNEIINQLQKCLKFSIILEDLELFRTFWGINSKIITNMASTIVKKKDVDEALKINDNYRTFLKECESNPFDLELAKCDIDIQLHRGDCYYFNYDYGEALINYKNAKDNYVRNSLNRPYAKLRIFERLGATFYREGSLEDALKIVDEALELIETLPKRKLKTLTNRVKFNHFKGGLLSEKFDQIKYSFVNYKIALDNIKRLEKEKSIPEITKIKATLLHNLGLHYTIIGNKTKAKEYFDKSLIIYEELAEKYTESQYFSIVELLWRIQTEYQNYFTPEELEDYKTKFLEIINERNKQNYSKIEYIEILRYHADLLKHNGEFKECLRKINQALEEFDELPIKLKMLYNSKVIKSKLHAAKAQILYLFNDFNNAELEYAQSLDSDLLITKKPRDLYRLLNFYKNYASGLTKNNKFTLARNLYHSLKEYISQLYKANPKIYRKLFVKICNDKAIMHYDIGEFKNSLKELNQASNELDDLIKKQRDELLENKINIGQNDILDGHYELIGSINDQFGLVNIRLGKFKEAKNHLEKSYNARRHLFEKYNIKYASHYLGTLNHYSLVLDKLNLKSEAEKLLQTSIINSKRFEKPNSPNLRYIQLLSLTNLAFLYYQNKKIKKSIEYYEKAYALIKNGGILDTQAITLKAKINLHYIKIKSNNSNIHSKILEELNLYTTLKEIENLPIIEKQNIKAEIEDLYLWLLVKELQPMVDKQDIQWSNMMTTLKIISTLRSGESFLFKMNQDLIKEPTDVNLADIECEIHEIMIEKFKITKELFSSNSDKPEHLLLQEKNILMNKLRDINLKGFELTKELESANAIQNSADKLKDYLKFHKDECLYIIQSTGSGIFHILLSSQKILIKTTDSVFIIKGLKLQSNFAKISTIDSINDADKYNFYNKQLDRKSVV